MRRYILALVTALATVCHGQNTALSQLGAKGVTEVGGTTEFAHYLPRLNAEGRLSSTLLPAYLGTIPLNNTYVVDSLNGYNTTNSNGSFTRPFQTIAYAIDHGASNCPTFILAPGTYGSMTIDTSTDPGLSNVTIVATAPHAVTVNSISYSAISGPGSLDARLTLYDVSIGDIRQYNNRITTLRLYGQSRITDTVRTDYTNCVVTLDPQATVGAFNVAGTLTTNLTHNAAQLGYTATPDGNWRSTVPGNVQDAIDALAIRADITNGVHIGQIAYWNGVRWVPSNTGTVNQILVGGPTPAFSNLNAELVIGIPPAVSNGLAALSNQAAHAYYPADNSLSNFVRMADVTGTVVSVGAGFGLTNLGTPAAVVLALDDVTSNKIESVLTIDAITAATNALVNTNEFVAFTNTVTNTVRTTAVRLLSVDVRGSVGYDGTYGYTASPYERYAGPSGKYIAEASPGVWYIYSAGGVPVGGINNDIPDGTWSQVDSHTEMVGATVHCVSGLPFTTDTYIDTFYDHRFNSTNVALTQISMQNYDAGTLFSTVLAGSYSANGGLLLTDPVGSKSLSFNAVYRSDSTDPQDGDVLRYDGYGTCVASPNKLADYAAVVGAVEGQIAWDYSNHRQMVYNGTAWETTREGAVTNSGYTIIYDGVNHSVSNGGSITITAGGGGGVSEATVTNICDGLILTFSNSAGLVGASSTNGWEVGSHASFVVNTDPRLADARYPTQHPAVLITNLEDTVAGYGYIKTWDGKDINGTQILDPVERILKGNWGIEGMLVDTNTPQRHMLWSIDDGSGLTNLSTSAIVAAGGLTNLLGSMTNLAMTTNAPSGSYYSNEVNTLYLGTNASSGGGGGVTNGQSGVWLAGLTVPTINNSVFTFASGTVKTPTMTGNYAPSNACYATASTASAYDPWLAFDKDTGPNGSLYQMFGTAFWMIYKFNVAVVVNRYGLEARNTTVRSPKDFAFWGSNDSNTWDRLDSQINSTNVSLNAYRYFPIANSTAYTYYKLTVTNLQVGNDGYAELGEFALINSDNYTSTPSLVSSVPSQVTDEYGTNTYSDQASVTKVVGKTITMASPSVSISSNLQVSGTTTLSKPLNINGSSDTNQLRIVQNATQTVRPVTLYDSDATTLRFGIDYTGAIYARYGRNSNLAIGNGAGSGLNSASYGSCVFLGSQAGYTGGATYNRTGLTIVGNQAGYSSANMVGDESTVVGNGAFKDGIGAYNSVFGSSAGSGATAGGFSGAYNLIGGYKAGLPASYSGSQDYNVFLGAYSGYGNPQYSSNNTCVGTYAGAGGSSGYSRMGLKIGTIMIGFRAGEMLTNANYVVVVDSLPRTNAAHVASSAIMYGVIDPIRTNQTITNNAHVYGIDFTAETSVSAPSLINSGITNLNSCYSALVYTNLTVGTNATISPLNGYEQTIVATGTAVNITSVALDASRGATMALYLDPGTNTVSWTWDTNVFNTGSAGFPVIGTNGADVVLRKTAGSTMWTVNGAVLNNVTSLTNSTVIAGGTGVATLTSTGLVCNVPIYGSTTNYDNVVTNLVSSTNVTTEAVVVAGGVTNASVGGVLGTVANGLLTLPSAQPEWTLISSNLISASVSGFSVSNLNGWQSYKLVVSGTPTNNGNQLTLLTVNGVTSGYNSGYHGRWAGGADDAVVNASSAWRFGSYNFNAPLFTASVEIRRDAASCISMCARATGGLPSYYSAEGYLASTAMITNIAMNFITAGSATSYGSNITYRVYGGN